MSNKLVKPRKNTGNVIVIDDGSKIYDIVNKNGKWPGKFEFRPADTNIIKRYEEVVEFYNNYKVSEGKELTVEERNKVEKEVIDKMSYLIGADAEEAFFTILGAFSPLASGEFFIENVLKSISKVIEQELAVRTSKVQRRVNKYVAKYHN